MYLKDIDARISHIQETIKATTAQVQGYTQSLQQASQQLSSLQGHLNECLHWKQQLELTDSHIKEAQLEPDLECNDEQDIEQDEEQAA